VEEGIAPQFVDGASVAMVRLQVLLGVGHRALVDRAVLSGSEVVHILLTVGGEVDRKTASVDEGHAAAFLLDFGASVDILLVGVGLTLELHELGVLETLSEGPLDNFTVTSDGHEGLALVLTLNPLDIPNDISVLEVQVL